MTKLPFGSKFSNRTADGKLFKNIGDTTATTGTGMGDMLKWQYERVCGRHPHAPRDGFPAFGEKWFKPCDFAAKLMELRQHEAETSTRPADRVFWIGHASHLLCLHSGTNILFDPVFSYRVSPVSFSGPSRRFPAAVTVPQLPRIDVVTVSHNHYDHLDQQAICDIYKRFPDVRFVVPLKMENEMKPWGIPASSIISLDWWEETRVNDVVIALTPAQHWCRRRLNDLNKVLWGGWCVGWNPSTSDTASPNSPVNVDKQSHSVNSAPEAPTAATPTATDWNALKTYYFTGDTAFNEDVFTEIHKHYPRIDFAALPIGAYAPRWFMSHSHIDPEHAVKIFQILKVQRAFAVHWGTFELADEPMDEPPEVLRAALNAEGLSEDAIQLVPMGEHIDF